MSTSSSSANTHPLTVLPLVSVDAHTAILTNSLFSCWHP